MSSGTCVGSDATAHVALDTDAAANGSEHTPRIPDFPGTGSATIEMLHSSAYRNASPYADKRVLVVGSGLAGMEIARDLETGGVTKFGWWSARRRPSCCARFPAACQATWCRCSCFVRRRSWPMRWAGRRGKRTSATSASSGCRSRLNPDAVVLATGYVRGLELETLASHLGVLEERGRPVVIGQANLQGTVSRLDTGSSEIGVHR